MSSPTARRPPRALHPGAWWLWALSIAIAASRTTNPLLLGLLVAVASYVVAARRQLSPWGRSYAVFLRLAAVVIVIRVALFALLAPASGRHVLVRLPELPLPHWLAGLRLGGPIAAEGLVAAAYDGLRLAVVLACIGAANSLTSPRRLLKSLPAALYEAGVALTVAVAFVPQAVTAVGRVRQARALRGRSERGWRNLRGIALPVLEGALERSIDLAAAMDARGFGRRGGQSRATRRTSAVATLIGLSCIVASCYGVLAPGAPVSVGLPLLLAGVVLVGAGFVVGARDGGRSRHRADPWRLPEWLVAACGPATVACVVLAHPDTGASVTQPLAAPAAPALALVGVCLALLPAWIAPPLPRQGEAAPARRRDLPAPTTAVRAAS